MSNFECERCSKVFKQKCDLVRHRKRKYPCAPRVSEVSEEANVSSGADHRFSCKFCGKAMKHYQSRWRHEQQCSKKNNVDSIIHLLNREHEKEKKEWAEEREQMREQIKFLLEKVMTPQVTHNHNNTYIVNINQFGNEDVSYISRSYIARLLKRPSAAVPELLREIHFNPEHPENRNVKITSRRTRFGEVFSPSGWQLMRKQDILDKMVDRGCSILDTCFDDMPGDKVVKYKEYQEKMDDDDSKVRKRTLEDAELLVLNHSKEAVGKTD